MYNICNHNEKKVPQKYPKNKSCPPGFKNSHSSPSVTMRYLGIEDKEVNGILMNEI